MYPYGKMAWNGVAAMSYLAACYDGGRTKANSATIAENRDISKALIAKVLTILSQAGLIAGSPGPGGGYYLAKDPGGIRLIDIVRLFERVDLETRCPFGPNWCGHNDPCPLHDEIVRMNERTLAFLERTTLAVFAANAESAPPAASS